MQQYSNSQGDLLVLRRGEELMTQLGAYAKEKSLTSAWVSGLGGAGKTILGFYDIGTRDYSWREFEGPMEILSLTGNLAWVDGEPFWHVHGSFSGADYSAVGGHVKEMIVGLTCELFVTPLEAPLMRAFDDETGLKLLSNGK